MGGFRTVQDDRSGTLVRRVWPLAALAGAVVGLALAGVLPRWSGLVHLVALPPLDLYTDLRLLLTSAPSVPVFVAGLLGALAIRVAVLALLLGGLRRRQLRFAAIFYLTLLPVLLVAAVLDFTAYAILYARLFWASLAVVAVVSLVAAAVPWVSGEFRLTAGWRRVARAGFRLPVLLGYAAVVGGIGVLADRGGGLVPIWLVPVSALATLGVITALSRRPAGRPWLRTGMAAGLVAVLGLATVVSRTAEPVPPAPPRAGSLLLMSGVNSASGSGSIFETDVALLGYDCDQVYYFSYAGTGDGAPQRDATCPIRTGAPYSPEDTLRPVAEQVELFAAQVRDLPRPLVVSGHSLAAWIAWEAVAGGDAPEVDVLILVGPFPEGPVAYPPPGEAGPGRVGGDLMRALMPLAGYFDFDFDPDAPAARELLAAPGAAGEVFERPLPDRIRSLSIPTTADLPLMPGGRRLPVDRNACPVREAHPDLPEHPTLYAEVNRFLAGEPPVSCPRWRDWGAPLVRPFGVPPTAAGGFGGDSPGTGSAWLIIATGP